DPQREAPGRRPRRHAAVVSARDRGPRRRRRRRGGRRQDGRGPLRRRVVEHRRAVRRVVGPRRHVQVRPRQGPGHPGLGPGRRRHEGRRPAPDHDPADARLRQARRGRRHRPGRDARLRGRPRRRAL
ncbi:MAG: Peptidylprolyl isomerase, FKBP-type, partial [uncultured Solirubrobacteraceae bacterium]